MGWPSLSFGHRQRDEIVAVDLGGRHTKAVHIQNKGGQYHLVAYTIQDSPTDQAATSVDVLAEHLKSVLHAMGNRMKEVAVAVGSTDTVVRRAELPPMPVGDMRQLLKFNSKGYLQQDLPDHVFDCAAIVPRAAAPNGAAPEAARHVGSSHKQKVLVGAAKRRVVEDLETAVKQAGLVPTHIVPAVIGPVNAFEVAEAPVFANETVALVDLGFRNTTVCMIQQGELVMHRVVNIAGDRLTGGLAEAMSISYAEAEGIKIGMPSEVQGTLEPLVTSLGRELRAFIDFFEHQQDVPVTQVLLSGGSSRGELIVQALQLELLVPCRVWNPAQTLQVRLAQQPAADFQPLAPQFAVAIGAALSAL